MGTAIVMVSIVSLSVCHTQISSKLSEIDLWLLWNAIRTWAFRFRICHQICNRKYGFVILSVSGLTLHPFRQNWTGWATECSGWISGNHTRHCGGPSVVTSHNGRYIVRHVRMHEMLTDSCDWCLHDTVFLSVSQSVCNYAVWQLLSGLVCCLVSWRWESWEHCVALSFVKTSVYNQTFKLKHNFSIVIQYKTFPQIIFSFKPWLIVVLTKEKVVHCVR